MVDAGVSILLTYGEHFSGIGVNDDMTHVHFSCRDALNAMLQSEIQANDVVLFKGSRGMKMEQHSDACRRFLS